MNAWDLTAGKRFYNFRNNWNGGVARDEGAYYFRTDGGSETRPTAANPSTHTIERTEAKIGSPLELPQFG